MLFIKRLSDLFLNKLGVIFIVFLFLLKPASVSLNGEINLIFNIVSIIFIAIIIILYLSRGKFSKLQISIFIFITCIGVSTFFGTKDFGTFFKNYGVILAVSLYTEMLINNDLEKFLKALSTLISIYIIVNLLTVVFTNGFSGDGTLHDFYFLGYDNGSVHIIVLGLFVMMISSHYFYNKLTPFVLTIIGCGVLTYYLEWAASCLVSIALLIFYVIFIYKRKTMKKILDFRFIFGFTFIIFLIIVVFRWQNNFSWLIVDILHKDLTFTGRLVIWDKTLFQICKHPILGLGVQNEKIRLAKLGIYHAHSNFLNVLLESGIIGFVAFLNVFRVATKSLTRKENMNNEIASICTFALFVYLISTLVEVIMDDYLFYILLNICYFIPFITDKKKKREV